ncbi:FG-GAP repeat-containing protein [Entamoeba marina]
MVSFITWFFLVKNQHISELEPLFEDKYSGNWKSELNTIPLITDIDGDGHNDVVIAGYATTKLSIYSFNKGKLDLKNEVKLPTTSFPIYLTSGYDTPYSATNPRAQTIVVILRDFTILCYNHDLTLRWKSSVYASEAQPYVQEVSAIVVPYQIQKNFPSAVITSFRTSNDKFFAGYRADDEFEEDQRVNFDTTYTEQREDIMDDAGDVPELIEHLSYFALNAKDGQVIWQHVADETNIGVDLIDTTDVAEEYKRERILGKVAHESGEVSWHEFHDAVFDSLPHSWSSYYDTSLIPKHFSRDLIGNPEKYVTFNEQYKSPHNSFDRIKNPNVFVVHHMNGLEVVHLFTGKPLLHVSLITSSITSASSFADLDGDDTLDEVYTHALVGFDDNQQDYTCYLNAISLSTYRPLFTTNICVRDEFSLSQIREEIDKNYLHTSKPKAHIQTLPPLLLKQKFVGPEHNRKYTSFALSSNGLLTAVEPDGKLLWRSDLPVSWRVEEVQMKTFKPSLVPFHYHKQNDSDISHDFLLAQGDHALAIVDDFGNVVAYKHYNKLCHPIMPPVIGDLNGDGFNDIVIVTEDHIMAYSLVLVPSVEFLPAFISIIIGLISYNIYLIAIAYFKKTE